MIRRSPTKIELRLDDLQEYEVLKKERDFKREAEKLKIHNVPSWGGKLTQAEIQERIGFVPQTPQPAPQRRSNITL